MLGGLYLVLSLINRKLDRIKSGLSCAAMSILFGIVMLSIYYSATPGLVKSIRFEISKIESLICESPADAKGRWMSVGATKSLVAAKVDYVNEGDFAEIRSSPLIFWQREMIRV